MEKVQKPSTSVCYTPSSEPYRIEYLCLGKLKVGKLERKFCLHQTYLYLTLYLWSQLTLESHTEHSFSVTLMYYKSCISSNNMEVSIYYSFHYNDGHQFSTGQDYMAKLQHILQNYNEY
jgi:hypothetical protein